MVLSVDAVAFPILAEFLRWAHAFIANYGYPAVFIIMLLLNLIPFIMPPNWLVVAFIGAVQPQLNPITLAAAGALGAALGRSWIYLLARGGAKLVSDERRERLIRLGQRLGQNGAILAFVFATTPLPDDALIIAFGVMKYKWTPFFLGYISGKLISYILAIFLFKVSARSLGLLLGAEIHGVIIMAIASVVLTVAMIMVDWEKLLSRFIERKQDTASS